MAYEGGFQIGKEIGAINIPSMDKELMFYTQLNASKLAAEKKAEADKQKNIDKVVESQRKENAEWIYEDKIDDVGMEQADQAAAKFQQQVKNGYERDTYLYSVGALSQTDYTRNNTKRKASVKEVQSLYTQANTFIKEKNDLVASGKDSYINDLKAEVMGDLMKHVSYKNNTDGRTELSTINTRGQRINMFSSTLKDLSTAENGLEPDTIVNKLVTESGFIKYDSVSGKYRYTDYATGKMSGSNKERTGRLLDAAFEGYTDTQYIDLANRLGLVSDDKEEAEKEGLIHVDATNFLRKSPEEIQEIKKRARDGVSQYFTDRLELKEDRGMAPPKPSPDVKTPKYDRSYYNKQSAGDVGVPTDFNEYTFKDPKPVKGLSLSGFKIPVPRDNTQVLQEPSVVAYRDLGNGDHFVKISSKVQKIEEVPVNGKLTKTGKTVEEEKFTYVPLATRTEVNQIRSLYGIPILSDKEQINQTGILD